MWSREVNKSDSTLPELGENKWLCHVHGGGGGSSSSSSSSSSSNAHRISAIHCASLLPLIATVPPSVFAAADATGSVTLAFISPSLAVSSSLLPSPSSRTTRQASHVSRHMILQGQRISHVKCFPSSPPSPFSSALFHSVLVTVASFEGCLYHHRCIACVFSHLDRFSTHT